MRIEHRLLVLALLGLLSADRAMAQFTQYTSSSGFLTSPEATRNQLQAAMDEAPWSFGRFSISPWLALREITWDDNVGNLPDAEAEAVSDFSVTVGGGIRTFTPVGRGLIWASHLLPEYVWWQDLADRRRFNGRYGTGIFGLFGRTEMELSARRDEGARFFSRELEDQINTRTDVGRASFDVAIAGGVSVLAAGSLRRHRFGRGEVDLPQVQAIDRDEEISRAMLRYRPRGGVLIGAGVERSDTTFEEADSRRDNSGTSPAFELSFTGGQLSVETELVARELTFDRAALLDFEETTGRARVKLDLPASWALILYGTRNVVYSFSDVWAYNLDTTAGLAIESTFSSRVELRVYSEQGDNEYRAFEADGPRRIDDFDGYGAELGLGLGAGTLILGGYRSQYDSNLPAFDRTVTILRTGFVFGKRSVSPWL